MLRKIFKYLFKKELADLEKKTVECEKTQIDLIVALDNARAKVVEYTNKVNYVTIPTFENSNESYIGAIKGIYEDNHFRFLLEDLEQEILKTMKLDNSKPDYYYPTLLKGISAVPSKMLSIIHKQ